MIISHQQAYNRETGRSRATQCVVALFAILLLLTPASVRAADPTPPVWQGVWRGMVGTLPVRACLAWDRVGPGDAFGAYYYLSKLRTIHLAQQGTSRVWVEGDAGPKNPPGPRWTFAEVGRDRLAGTWSDGKHTLPFRLERVGSGVADDDDDGPCGTEAFNGPRWRPLTVTAASAVMDGVRYRALAFEPGPAFPTISMTGFELIGDDAATRRLNLGLRGQVPGSKDDWHECVTGGLEAHGEDGYLEQALAPTLITSRWLGAALTQEDDCGGAHPNNSTVPVTFDRTTGATVDLHTWLNDAALDHTEASAELPPTVRPAFRRLILANAGELEADCRKALADEEFWDIGLDRRGLTFRPELPHVVAVCADDELVPWATLARFLTPAGRAGRASLATR